MSLEDQLPVTIRVLPPERQREVLDEIRDKARDVDEADLQTLIDEARQDYSRSTSR